MTVLKGCIIIRNESYKEAKMFYLEVLANENQEIILSQLIPLLRASFILNFCG